MLFCRCSALSVISSRRLYHLIATDISIVKPRQNLLASLKASKHIQGFGGPQVRASSDMPSGPGTQGQPLQDTGSCQYRSRGAVGIVAAC